MFGLLLGKDVSRRRIAKETMAKELEALMEMEPTLPSKHSAKHPWYDSLLEFVLVERLAIVPAESAAALWGRVCSEHDAGLHDAMDRYADHMEAVIAQIANAVSPTSPSNAAKLSKIMREGRLDALEPVLEHTPEWYTVDEPFDF